MPTRYWDRILKGSLTSLPPPSPHHQPQGLLQARPPSGLGLQGLAAPSLQPGSCSLRDLSCAWQGPASHVAAEGGACIPPHVRFFNSPSVPWSQNIQNHTLPALIYSADHPSTFKQDLNCAGQTTPLTHSGWAHKTRRPRTDETPHNTSRLRIHVRRRLPEKMFFRFSTAAASWLCRTTASFTSLRLSMVLMLCLQSLLTSARDCWMALTSFSALWSWLRPVRTPSNCDWIAA